MSLRKSRDQLRDTGTTSSSGNRIKDACADKKFFISIGLTVLAV